ncbi:unannotated protein [freshwater metagenome]|uniref:Unannotated protein n=1 Tax=freshwater metagenome TaxID=449393 RepID=A0A6J6DNC6_9ZZZZ
MLVRPHQLRVSADGPHTVMRVEFLGATHRYTIRADDGSTLVSDVGPTEPLAVGSNCAVAVIDGVTSPGR